MKNSNRWAIVALSLLIALLGIWGTIAAAGRQSPMPLAAPLSAVKVAAPAAQAAEDEPPLVGYPCGDGAQMPYWTICLHGDLLNAAGEPAGRPGLPVTVEFGGQTRTSYTRVRPGQPGATYAIDISELNPDYMGEVTLTVGELGPFKVIVAPDLRTQNLRFDVPVDGAPAGRAAEDPVVVWGYVIDFLAREPLAGVPVTIATVDDTGEHLARTVTTQHDNQPWPIYTFTQAQLDAAGVVLTDRVPYPYTITTSYNGDSVRRDRTWTAGEESAQVNLFTNWMCDTPGEGGGRDQMPKPPESGVAPRLKPDGLPETTGADGLPDMGCFWGYVEGTNGEEENVTVRLEVAGQVMEDTTFKFEHDSGDGRPRYGIIVQGLADIQGQPLTVTAVLSGSTAVYTGTVALDAAHSQQIDLELPVSREKGTLLPNQGTNSIVLLGDFVYAATDNGLIRFDATSETGNPIRVPGGPEANPVEELTKDSDGYLWLVSRGQVYRYYPPTEEWREWDEDQTGADVTAIAAGADRSIWFGNLRGELHVYRLNGQPEWAAIAVIVPLGSISDVSVSPAGVVWVSAGHTLARYDPQAETPWRTVSVDSELSYVAAEAEGAWVTRSTELSYAKPTGADGIALTNHTHDSCNIQYTALQVDAMGNAWVVCKHDPYPDFAPDMYVFKYNPLTDGWTTVIESSGEAPYSIAVEGAGQNLWLGTVAGVNRYAISTGGLLRRFEKTALFSSITTGPNTTAANADALFLAHRFEEAGFSQYDLDTLAFEAAPAGGFGDGARDVRALAIDPVDGSLWVAFGGNGQGVGHYTAGAATPWTYYPVSDNKDTGLMSSEVYAIARYGNKVWFATTAGISILDLSTQQWTPLLGNEYYLDDETTPTTDLENVPEDLLVDANGIMWLSGDRGLRPFNQDRRIRCLSVPTASIEYDPVWSRMWALHKPIPPGVFSPSASPAAIDARYGEYWLRPYQANPDSSNCTALGWEDGHGLVRLYIESAGTLTTDRNGDVWISVDGCPDASPDDNDAETVDLAPGLHSYDTVAHVWQVHDVEFDCLNGRNRSLGTNTERDQIILKQGNTITVLDVPLKQPDLDLQLSAPPTWAAGPNLTYTLVITNTGLRPAPDTTLTLDLPAGFTFQSAVCSPTPCGPPAASPLTWSLGQLEPGEVRLLTITATGNAPVDTTLEATATTATTAAEAYTANNTAGPAPTLVLDVRPDARISLVGPTELKPGTTVTFTLRADNAGGSPVTGDIKLELGPYLSTAVTQWPGVVLPPSLNPDEPPTPWEQTIQVTVATNAPPNTRLSPRASVTTAVEEKDPLNNESVVTISTTLADARTLIVVATAQLGRVYGASTILDDAYRLAGHDAVHGTVLDVSTDDAVAAAYEAWNAAHDGAATDANALANATAEAIGRRVLVELRANPQIQYVVIVGGDHVIPFFRRADHNPTQWQESTYAGAFLPTNTTVYEALWANTFLTDDCYTDHQRTPVTASGWFGPDLCIPDLAVGRLVETPQEIRAAVDAFVAIGGEVTLGPAIVGSTAGDDDGADEAGDESGLTLDLDDNQCQLLRKAGLVARCRQSNRRFRERLLDTHFTTAVAAQHSSHYGVGLFRSSDVLESDVSYVGMLLATIGCHAGLSVPPRAPGSEAVDHDMPQAILGRGGTLIGLTTYGYGTKEGMGYSESFSRLLTQELLRAEPGQVVEIGPAIVRAKQAYITRHWGEAGAAGGFTYLDEKVVLPVTLYGLPMLRVRLPDTAGQARLGLVPPAPADVRLTASTTISTVHVVNPALYHEYSLAGGRYFDYDGQLFERVGLPLQPARDLALPVASGVRTARGALLRSATFTTFAPFTPYRAQAWALSAEGQTTTQPVKRGPIYMPLVAYQSPVSPWDHTLPFRFVYLDYGGSSAYLFTVLGAYNEHTGEERRYDSLVVDIVYGDGDDMTPPAIVQSDSFAAYGHLRLLAQAGDPSGISQVIGVCEYAAEGRWVSVDLRREGERWLGSCPTAEGVTRTLLQVVDGAGNVTIGEWQTPPTTTLTGPDLIVESVVATRDGIQITIRNVGTAAVTPEQGFWVDVYLAPDPPPAAEDDVWGDGRSDYGAAWAVEQAIPPGGAVTLTTTNGTPDPTHTRLPARLPLGAAVYAQVDSWSMETTYGGVLEMHELGDGPYNNVFGPVEVEATGRLGGASSTTRAAGASVPARPEVTR